MELFASSRALFPGMPEAGKQTLCHVTYDHHELCLAILAARAQYVRDVDHGSVTRLVVLNFSKRAACITSLIAQSALFGQLRMLSPCPCEACHALRLASLVDSNVPSQPLIASDICSNNTCSQHAWNPDRRISNIILHDNYRTQQRPCQVNPGYVHSTVRNSSLRALFTRP